MKNQNKVAIGVGILGAAVLAGFVFIKKRAIDSLNIFIWTVGVKFIEFKPVVTVKFRVQNPSNDSFEISSVVGLLMVNNVNIGNVSSFTKSIIPPTTETDYSVDVYLAFGGNAVDLVNTIQQGSGLSQNVQFVGNINANGILWPLTLDYKIV